MMKSILYTLTGIMLLLLIWKLIAITTGSDILMPPPETALRQLFSLIPHREFWESLGYTTLRVICGFGLSFASALAVGLTAGLWPVIYRILWPVISTLRTIPVMSVIILGMLWLVPNLVPVFVTFLMVFPLACAGIMQGIVHIDKKLIVMGKIFRLNSWQRIFHIILPSLVPFLLAAAKAGLGMAWKVTIAAEVLSQPRSAVGTGLRFAQINLETAEVMAWTTAAVILSGLTEKLLGILENRFRWETDTQ